MSWICGPWYHADAKSLVPSIKFYSFESAIGMPNQYIKTKSRSELYLALVTESCVQYHVVSKEELVDLNSTLVIVSFIYHVVIGQE